MSHTEISSSFDVVEDKEAPPIARQRFPLLLAIVLSLLIGFSCTYGYKQIGSFIVVPLLILWFFMVLLGPLTKNSALAAAVALLYLAAVAVAPDPVNLMVSWFAFSFMLLCQQGGQFSNPTALLISPLISVVKLADVWATPPAKKEASNTAHAALGRGGDSQKWLIPVLILIIFGGLLMLANSLISEWVKSFFKGNIKELISLSVIFYSLLASLALSFLLRLKLASFKITGTQALLPHSWYERYFQTGPILTTLALLNIMFLGQNLLDLNYLWLKDQALPAGMSYAAYVHRGSYTLIVTALLAALLVLFLLQPEKNDSSQRLLRVLIYLWLLQNMILVASSVMRTLSYIDAYGMTQWRLSGLLWMGLVMTGLFFIILRILFRRSNFWLLNMNVAASIILLLVCGFADFEKIIADWNVDQALSQAAAGDKSALQNFDLSYALSLGPSSIVALKRLDDVVQKNPELQSVHYYSLHRDLCALSFQVKRQQEHWQSWNLSNFIHPSIVAGEALTCD